MMKAAKSKIAHIYMNLWLSTFPTYHKYDVQERLRSGKVITHLKGVSYTEMREYVNRVWINSHPPEFVISVAYGKHLY